MSLLTLRERPAPGDPGGPPEPPAGGPVVAAGSSRVQWTVVAAVGLSVVGLAFLATRRVPVYLTADAGHYLADADAVLGGGVRESRHLPAFPLLLGALRFLAGDLLGVQLAMAVVVLLLVAGFATFVHGRLSRPGAEVLGVVFFALSPLMAEGIGWYAASMMLGFALVLFALRLVDEALLRPTLARVVGAGAVLGMAGLAHPLPFVIGAQVTVLAASTLALRSLISARRAGHRAGRTGLRAIGVVSGVGLVASAFCLTHVGFYTRLRPPLRLGFDSNRLADLTIWAFRDSPALWFGLLALALLLIPGGRSLGGEPGLRFGIWASALTLVALASVAMTAGHPSYTTRYLYALPVTLGCSTAVAGGLAARAARATHRSADRWLGLLLAVVLVATLVRATQSFWVRTTAAVPYYNLLTKPELEAIGWVGSGTGTVAVAPKGSDRVAGTLYAWMIEGLAHTRAIGTGEAFLSVLDEAQRDSLDVERLVAGSRVVEFRGLRLSASEARAAAVDVAARVGEDWFPVATVTAGPVPAGAGPPDIATTVDPEASLTVRSGEMVLRVSLARTRPEVVVELTGAGTDVSVVEVSPDHFATGVEVRPAGADVVLSRGAGVTGRIDMTILTPANSGARTERDLRSGSTRVHLETAGGQATRLRLPVAGVSTDSGDAVEFTDRDLIRRHGITRLFAWRDAYRASLLAGRECFQPLHLNTEVIVLAVAAPCRVEDRAAGGARP